MAWVFTVQPLLQCQGLQHLQHCRGWGRRNGNTHCSNCRWSLRQCRIQAWVIKSTNCWALNFVNSLPRQLSLRQGRELGEEEEGGLMFQKSEMLHLCLSVTTDKSLQRGEREDLAESTLRRVGGGQFNELWVEPCLEWVTNDITWFWAAAAASWVNTNMNQLRALQKCRNDSEIAFIKPDHVCH